MRRNAAWVMALVLAGCFSGGGGGGGEVGGEGSGNAAGTWQVTSTNQSTTCDGGSSSDSFELSITQSGSSVTANTSTGAGPFTGTLSGNRLTWSGSYPEQGGVTTVNLRGTLSGDSLTGTSDWSWTGDGTTCTGTDSVSATRISGGPSADSAGAGGGEGV